ncbi:MAG: choice-of-anchor L domain-containing protein [Flavobacteriales bacterium]|nr:choice-of-anchor L domain-containing protein [Flavobacteriales bacterium]
MTVQTALAQLQIDASYTPQQLVENVLIGQGVQVSNFQFTGNAASRGFFDGSASNIGLSSGVILSTGRVIDAIGPNNTQAGSLAEDGTGFSTPGDAALTAISGLSVGTYDASILEFDFIPSSDTVQFRYVFASDEYMVWVDTSVSINDVFAFLISGPGISGESNIALLPGTTLPITMLNVNASTNSQYYIDNGDDPGESGGATVSYNGFTKVLTAQAVLTPCQSYHIRLAIADGGDGTYDSAVFLEAGSFSSPTVSMSAESSFSATSGGQDLVEGCSSTTLTFERSAPFDAPLTVGLAFSGTATVGADISNLPSSITFPAGQATTTISFNVIEDGVLEGTENLTIVLDQLNPCATGPATSVTITIQDALPLTLQISPDVSLICPEERIISVVPTGGYPTYQYQWAGTSSSTGSVTVNPFSSSTYTVMVTDTCGFTATASTSITIPNYQPIQVNVTDAIICNGEEAILEAQVSGGLGNITYLWDGSGTDATYAVSPVASTTVLLQVTDSCGITEDGQANVIVDEVDVSFTSKLTAHSTVQFTSSSTDITDFAWDFGDGTFGFRESPLHEYLEEGTYIVTLTVTNSNGCEATVEDTVTVYPPLHVYVPNSFTPNGDGINDEFGMIGEGYLYYDMEIFDRWGNRLKFGRFKDDTVWDGTYKGSLVPAGMYIYSIVVHPPIGIDVREKGSLFVLP